MSIFVCGDIHGTKDIGKLEQYFYIKEGLTKKDYLIICGDTEICGFSRSDEKDTREFLRNLPVTVLFCDGNHENFEELDSYYVEDWHGGRVHRIESNIIHLMHYEVDYIITHTAPYEIAGEIGFGSFDEAQEQTREFQRIAEHVDFKHWFFGHFHLDEDYEKFHCLMDKVIALLGNHEEWFLNWLEGQEDVWLVEDRNLATSRGFLNEDQMEELSKLVCVKTVFESYDYVRKCIRENHRGLLHWLKRLPRYYKTETQMMGSFWHCNCCVFMRVE